MGCKITTFFWTTKICFPLSETLLPLFVVLLWADE
jgi:hypothetical protein